VVYHGYTDPAGGSGQDSWTGAVAHLEGRTLVLDALLEKRPPFSPEACAAELCDMFKRFRIGSVVGDRFAGQFPRELFARNGVQYRVADQHTSDNYRDLLPELNSGNVRLLDNQRLVAQLCNLERKAVPGAKDKIHIPGTSTTTLFARRPVPY
jgi:hypothetical protein